MRYPTDLVHRYGAKAGILMYIQEHLPHIPQVDMIVKTPEESIDDALKRADKQRILWPRIFRSSAVAELYGHEGDFPTKIMEGFEAGRAAITNPRYLVPYSSRERFDDLVRGVIRDIQTSPRDLKEADPPAYAHLPDDISVIIAEQSPSSITGTYIRHPNQKECYVVSATVADSLDTPDPLHSAYICDGQTGVQHFHGFDKRDIEKSGAISPAAKARIPFEIETIIPWHDQIARLPEMDPGWTYQIEFGLDPTCLYQVRPFKPMAFAGFTLPPADDYIDYLVIGITPREGIAVRVETNLWERGCNREEINPDHQPSLLYDCLRSARSCDDLPNHQANLLTGGFGILAHGDIKAMRRAQVSVIFIGDPYYNHLHQGDRVILTSDGKTFSLRTEETSAHSPPAP